MAELTPLSYPADNRKQTHSSFPFSPGAPTSKPAGATADNRMQQLETMLQEAQGRAEIVEKEAYEKAYLAGEKAGMALGKKRGEQILEALQLSLSDAEQHIQDMQHAFAEAAMDVAGHIAEQIVGQVITQDTSTLLDIAMQAAARLPDSDNLRIAVANDDYSSFKRLLDDESTTTRLTADATVLPGTCRIISSTQDCLIDPVAAVNRCLHELKPVLLSRPASTEATPPHE